MITDENKREPQGEDDIQNDEAVKRRLYAVIWHLGAIATMLLSACIVLDVFLPKYEISLIFIRTWAVIVATGIAHKRIRMFGKKSHNKKQGEYLCVFVWLVALVLIVWAEMYKVMGFLPKCEISAILEPKLELVLIYASCIMIGAYTLKKAPNILTSIKNYLEGDGIDK